MAAVPDSDDLSVAWIGASAVDECYGFLHEHITEAAERDGLYTAEDIIAEIKAGKMGAIVIKSEADGPLALVTVRTEQFPKKRVLEVITIGGREFLRWRQLFTDVVGELASKTGCQSVRGYARPGLAKGLVQLGSWRMKFVAVEM